MGKKRTSRNSGVGKVRLQWALLLDGLRGLGWTVAPQRAMQAAYQSGSGRPGSVWIHYRGGGVWRYAVDGGIQQRGGYHNVPVRRPDGSSGGVGNDITLMADEVEAVTEWLLRWIVVYDAGQPLPDMPDGTPYPGGYVWTKAKEGVA